MLGTRWAIGAGLALMLAGPGCVSCGHDVCKPALEASPNAEAPVCDRRHVYAFLINGITPAGSSGLDGLRIKLAERGYEKTYRGECCHAWWMEHEMKRVLKCDPAARFVVVGYDVGCGAASSLARHAVRHGWPVDAVVLLDPVIQPEAGPRSPHTIVIRSGAAATGDEECVCVPSGGHWTLPTNARTVEVIAEVMKEAASKVEYPPVLEGERSAFPDAPPLREMPGPVPGAGEDWLFLHDQFGTHTRPLTPVPQWGSADLCAPACGTHPSVLPKSVPLPGPGFPLPIPKKLEQSP
jgi:hypothetical protein